MKPYQPYGAALDLWRCKSPEVVICGPAGTGKSRAVLEKVFIAASKYHGSRCLILRQTRISMTESVLVTLESSVLVDKNGMRLGWVGPASRRTRTSYDMPNGSAIVVGAVENADRLMSTDYDMIAVFEATEVFEDDFEKLTTRLRNFKMPYQQIIADCNPAGPQHWIKRRCDSGRAVMLHSRHEHNPLLWDSGRNDWTDEGRTYLSKLNALSGHRKARLRDGIWSAAEGGVYPEWNPAAHVIREMPAGWLGWPKVRSIDFGYTNPFVCQWWAIDPDGRMYLYREYVRAKRTIAGTQESPGHAAEIMRMSHGEEYIATVADHDAEDRATLAEQGIYTVAARKAVTTGIAAMQVRLANQGDGRPRLFVLRGALTEYAESDDKAPVGFLAEIDGYCYPKVREGKTEKEEPIKLHDHSMDAARYAVAYFDLGANAGACVSTPTEKRVSIEHPQAHNQSKVPPPNDPCWWSNEV